MADVKRVQEGSCANYSRGVVSVAKVAVIICALAIIAAGIYYLMYGSPDTGHRVIQVSPTSGGTLAILVGVVAVAAVTFLHFWQKSK